MNRLLLLTFALIAAGAVACGGGGSNTPTPTYTLPAGVNGSLPRHLTSVVPAQASTVSNADLHIGETNPTSGICATFDFTPGDGMGPSPTALVQLLVNQEDVTDSANWVITLSQPPTGGTICYAAPQPFDPGLQLITLNYSEVTDRRFTYSWSFTVTG